MIQTILNKVSFNRNILRSNLPFGFCGETCICPTCIGIGLIVADMADRFGFINLAQSRERHRPPITIALLPIQRSLPLLRTHGIPAFREPQEGILIAAILYELQVLAICDQARGQLEGLQELPVSWSFIIKRKSLALMSDPIDPFRKGDPF